MPINTISQVVYVDDPDNFDSTTLYTPADLGHRFTTRAPLSVTQGEPVEVSGSSRSFQIVRVDSTLTVMPTRGDVMLWKSKASYIVTPKVVNALNRNEAAGVMPGGITAAGNYTCIQYLGPQYVKVTAADAASVASGDSLIPSAADDGRATRIAAGTAPTYTKLGTALGPVVSGNMALCDLNIPQTT